MKVFKKVKIRKIATFFVSTLGLSFLVGAFSPVIASAKENPTDVNTTVYDAGLEISVTETEEIFDGYTIKTYTDSEGNVSVFDSRKDYVVENGEEIAFDVSVSTELSAIQSNGYVSPLASLPAWQRIRRSTYTIAFEKAIKDLTVSSILGAMSGYLLAIYTVAVIIKAAHEKPDLRASQKFYIRSDQYGKTNSYNQVATHSYSLDTKYRKVSKTDKFSNQQLKTFLGY